MDETVGVSEVRRILGVGRDTAYILMQSGEIAAFKRGKSWRTTREAIYEYIQTQLRGAKVGAVSRVGR